MITEAQRKQRRKYIGSSDPAKIMNLHPFENSYDAYLSKIHDMKEQEITEAAEIGNALEDDIVDWVAEKYKVKYTSDPNDLFHISKEHPLFACNLDALVLGDQYKTAIEAKYTGQADEWGYGEETIPDHFMIQVQEQMMVMGFDYIIVGVWIAYYGIERRHYVIKRNQKIIDRIIKLGEWWWQEHVIPKVPPKDSPLPIPKTFSRIPKIEGKIIDKEGDVWERREAAMEVLKTATKAKEALDSEVRAAMGDASAMRLGDGKFYGPHGKKNSYLVYKGEE